MKHFGRYATNEPGSRFAVLFAATAIVGILLCPTAACAQPGGGDPLPVDAGVRAAIVDSVTTALNEGYVFPGVAAEMEKHIRGRLERGDYGDLSTVGEFAEALTRDLREISHDGHLSVLYFDDEAVAELTQPVEPEVDHEREFERLAKQNFLFKKLEILPGNVGYLRFDGFVNATFSGATAIATLNFLAHCDALIIDLRQNGGGSPSLIQLITSYFFNEPTHLNSFYTPRTDSLVQFWSHAYVPGPRMADVDLYVLTSRYTFSGAEEFTYNLKNLDRATIVGETTGGGAHPVDQKLFPTLNVMLRVPFARAVNPITGTNWEGTGVSPHIEVPREMALTRAHLEALRNLRGSAEGEENIAALDWSIAGLESEVNPYEVDEGALATYVGTYGARKLTLMEGALYYQRDDGPVRKAIPMSDKLFRFKDIDMFRLEVVTDDAGKPVKLIGHYNNGRRDESPRTDGD